MTRFGDDRRDETLRLGLIGAVLLHLAIALLAIFGLPHFFKPEIIEEPVAVKLAVLGDISAAPKTDHSLDKKPKPDQTPTPPQPKPEPPKPAAAPPKAAPPPPAAQPEKKPETKPTPVPEKKPAEDKPKQQDFDKLLNNVLKKEQQNEFNSLLKDVLKQPPAPDAKAKSEKVQPAQEESGGPQTEQISEVPMTATEQDGIRAQIERVWNVDPGAQNIDQISIELRVALNPDGTVTRVEILNDQALPGFQSLADGAKRAVFIASPLQLPPGKYWPTIVLRFYPKDAINGG
ncbi:MAG TPA: hypothetical protein VHL08_10065 [Dongiaceae bacterium]|jgi:outer membrane biosynthesis protein TonB|nr:hypothetical protein [Dongiaceae bacterium]